MLDKYLVFVRGREPQDLPGFAGGGFFLWCVCRVQAWWRMLKPRWLHTLQRFRVYHIASHQIQFAWRVYQREVLWPRASLLEEAAAATAAAQGRGGGALSSSSSNNHHGSGGGGQGAPPLALLEANPSRHHRNKRFSEWQTPEDREACKIQHLWRAYTNRRIFLYYRDLIQFRLTGDPAQLLRTINPREASLFDKSMGIHVRFRLGGTSFPPVMFYKVFLLNPLCDVGSFAPRDYSRSQNANKPLEPHLRHNHPRHVSEGDAAAAAATGQSSSAALVTRQTSSSSAPSASSSSSWRGGGGGGSPSLSSVEAVHAHKTQFGQIRVGGTYFGTRVEGLGPEGTAGWYRRTECNEWRPVTHRLASDAAAATGEGVGGQGAAVEPPPGAVSAAEKASLSGGIAFHYSRVKRKEDVALKRKTKKREWLLAMYKEGLARERVPGAYGSSSSSSSSSSALLLPHRGATHSDQGGRASGKGLGVSGGTANGVANAFVGAKMGNENYAAYLLSSGAGDEEGSSQPHPPPPPKGGRRAHPGGGSSNSSNPTPGSAAVVARAVAGRAPTVNEAIVRALDPAEGSAGFRLGNQRSAAALDEDPDLAQELDAVLGDMGEVLQWSEQLDYEAYVANWHVLATSATAGSDYHAPHHRGSGAGRGPPRRQAHGPSKGSAVPEPDWAALHAQLSGGSV